MGAWADFYRFLFDPNPNPRQTGLPMIPPSTYGHGHNLGGDELPTSVGTEPLVGYRIWVVRASGESLGLFSVHVDYEWTPGLQEASCLPGGVNRRLHEEPSPHIQCVCGFYSILPDTPLDRWDHFIRGSVFGFGEVALSGRIIRCNAGMKAGKAEIVPPVTLEARCEGDDGGCREEPVQILSPTRYDDKYRGQCVTHKDQEGIDVAVFFPEVARQLSKKYGFRFLHWT